MDVGSVWLAQAHSALLLVEALMDLEPARPDFFSRSSAGGTLYRNASSQPIADGRRCTGATTLASKRSLNEHDGFSSKPVCSMEH